MKLFLKNPVAAVAGAAALLFSGCTAEKAHTAAPSAVPVVVATVEQKAVPMQLRAIGTVEAYNTVEVKARIAGELTAVHFTEGQEVRKGDLLFNIDQRPFEADLARAEGNLAKSEAQLANAEAEAARYERLMKEGVVAREGYEQRRTAMEALRATVQADRAAVEQARVQLNYTSIRAPIDGRTGSRKVDKGNIVKANDDPALVVINQVQPIYAAFALPEQYLDEVRRRMRQGRLTVTAAVPKTEEAVATGTLSFVDNTIDNQTGTITMKATFPNAEKRLWPGQFVDVVITLSERPNAVLAPTRALQTSQQGQFVFVIKPDMTAEQRPVRAGGTVADSTIIEEGLRPGEKVVTEGQIRLVPGAKVEIKSGAPAPAQGSGN